jgi:hypothetical protein
MRAASLASFAILSGLFVPAFCTADTASDRIAASANGGTLTDTTGGNTKDGVGESLAWLHNFGADSLITVGAEHQQLAFAQWTFGSIAGAVTRPIGDARYTFAAEAHDGAGDASHVPFHYSIEAADVTGTYFHRLSVTLEDRRIDVQTSHGNLPKFGLAYLWSPRWLTTVSYADSVSGNLGTHLYSARIDRYSGAFNVFVGAAGGQASPNIFETGTGFETATVFKGHRLREGYVGAVKSFASIRSDVTLIADYIDLSGSKRSTLTLNYVFHLQATGGGH